MYRKTSSGPRFFTQTPASSSLGSPTHPLLCHLLSLPWNCTNHYLSWPCANSCPYPVNTGDQVLSPLNQNLSSFSPKWQDPFQGNFYTPTATKFEGLLHWIHLTYLKPLSPPPQGNFSSYISTPTGPYSHKFQMKQRLTTLSLFPEEWGFTSVAVLDSAGLDKDFSYFPLSPLLIRVALTYGE